MFIIYIVEPFRTIFSIDYNMLKFYYTKIMDGFIIRQATINDVPFLVDTIIEAEKSGTDILSYSTAFGLTEEESRKYISHMLFEEVDGCELSISSFIVAEKNGQTAAAAAGWIEGIEGIPSHVLKGNLLHSILPKECIDRMKDRKFIFQDLCIEYKPNTFALGLVYVAPTFRGQNLTNLLIEEKVCQLIQINPRITEMYVQVFGNNLPAIRAYKRANFKVVMISESKNEEILQYLPSNKKLLMKNDLLTTFKQFYSNNCMIFLNILLIINCLFEDDPFIAFQF